MDDANRSAQKAVVFDRNGRREAAIYFYFVSSRYFSLFFRYFVDYSILRFSSKYYAF